MKACAARFGWALDRETDLQQCTTNSPEKVSPDFYFSICSFSSTGCYTKVKAPSLHYIYILKKGDTPCVCLCVCVKEREREREREGERERKRLTIVIKEIRIFLFSQLF